MYNTCIQASYVINWMTVGGSRHAIRKCNDTNTFLDHLSSLAILKHQKQRNNIKELKK